MPRLVTFFVRWNANGTVTQFMRRDFRVVILHFGFLDSLFSNIEARLGVSIEHIAFEAQRNASKAVFQTAFDRIPGTTLALRFGFAKRMGVETFNRVGIITGQCHSQTLEYVPGKYGVARIRNPFHLNLMAANVVGAFETLEGHPFNHTWEEDGRDTYIIRIERAEVRPEIADRMALDFARPLPGSLTFERCPRCKAPMELARQLKWMEHEGVILDTRTGTRVVMLDGYMVATVFREMASELGEEVLELLVDAQRQWTVDHVEQLGLTSGNGPLPREELEGAYRKYLRMLPLYGQGNPIGLKTEDPAVSVTVENPYQVQILAGTLQGLYEALEKAKSRVSWEQQRLGAVSFRVEPEDAGG